MDIEKVKKEVEFLCFKLIEEMQWYSIFPTLDMVRIMTKKIYLLNREMVKLMAWELKKINEDKQDGTNGKQK